MDLNLLGLGPRSCKPGVQVEHTSQGTFLENGTNSCDFTHSGSEDGVIELEPSHDYFDLQKKHLVCNGCGQAGGGGGGEGNGAF